MVGEDLRGGRHHAGRRGQHQPRGQHRRWPSPSLHPRDEQARSQGGTAQPRRARYPTGPQQPPHDHLIGGDGHPPPPPRRAPCPPAGEDAQRQPHRERNRHVWSRKHERDRRAERQGCPGQATGALRGRCPPADQHRCRAGAERYGSSAGESAGEAVVVVGELGGHKKVQGCHMLPLCRIPALSSDSRKPKCHRKAYPGMRPTMRNASGQTAAAPAR